MNTNKLFIHRCEEIVTSLKALDRPVDIAVLTKWLDMNSSAAYQVVNKMLVYNILSKQGRGKNATYSLSENLARKLTCSTISFMEIGRIIKQTIQDYNKPTALMPGRKLVSVRELISKVESVQDLILRVKNLEAKIAQYEKNM